MSSNKQTLSLTGGVGGAKLAFGLSQLLAPENLSFIVNTGDDQDHLGLKVSPDIDTLIYTLSQRANTDQGWGLKDESWQCMEALNQLGGETWFRLGDKDLATHLYRTEALKAGHSLTEVTRSIASSLGVKNAILPMSNQTVSTKLKIKGKSSLLGFHDYFVKQQCEPYIESIHFIGAEKAKPSEEITATITGARRLIICPSNPFLSIDPILSIPGLTAQLLQIPTRVVVCPIINGQAIKGPTAKIMQELGIAQTTLSIAQYYQQLATHFVIDHQDSHFSNAIAQLGIKPLVMSTWMRSNTDKINLAKAILSLGI